MEIAARKTGTHPDSSRGTDGAPPNEIRPVRPPCATINGSTLGSFDDQHGSLR